jgi:hypothetical protein
MQAINEAQVVLVHLKTPENLSKNVEMTIEIKIFKSGYFLKKRYDTSNR